jgi:hypothetical protein
VSASASLFKSVATASLLAIAGSATATTLQDLPRGARPGECFSHVASPAAYRTVREPVAQPPLVTWRDIPAVYRTVDKQVLVSPGRVDHEAIPAVTATRVHWVVHPGADRIIEAPAEYRWIEKRVLVAAAPLVWKPGRVAQGYAEGYGQGVSVRPTGEVMCRVLVPARYAVHRVRVLVNPGRTCVVKGPSTRERIVETYVARPARVIDHPIAPVYRTVAERVLVTPARKERIVTPQAPRYAERRVLVSPARTGWTRIQCAPPRAPAGYGIQAGYSVTRQPHVHAQPAPQPSYGQPYTPDYAQPRPGELYGAPQPAPAYHAPNPQSGQDYGSPSN